MVESGDEATDADHDRAVLEYVHPPADDILRGFPDARRTKAKTPFPGGKRRRWKDDEGNLYEWDYRHGRIERFNRRGDKHLGDFDPHTGERLGDPDPSRRVEP